ncbi:LysR family transcriptional regulator [Pararhodobacter marinus]|uniref:LysR family transcriptional regulator n=1 Tax=Pararhodobacter marinus TaxID=2184063 RepID=A0A2U2C9T1_9RHOB|nr:LysR family transcriptional regulator [Pararhodobacter marinus]PWE28612.1 LysR family transcriptional regulator [Pararhodobacter marinus]
MPVTPPPPRPPSLAHLAALDAVLRHGGYAAAGAALGVSPGALRAKLRALETASGMSFLAARAHSVQPTPEALALAAPLRQAFHRLEQALAPLGAAPLPLGALHGFEAALRTAGFAAAGAALGLSPGAVAAQVRRVERWAGRPLFERHAQGVRPLPDAKTVQPALATALGSFAALMARGTRLVRIAALPAVAQLWLAPRLPGLRAACPGMQVSVTALERLPEGKRAPYDLALFMGETGGQLLAEDALLPVCAPALAARLREPGDLSAVPCLEDSAWPGDWRRWCAAAAPEIAVPRGVAHSLYALAVDEALAGSGVLMGHRALLSRHLAEGRLVAPFAAPVPLARALRLYRLRPLRRGSAAERVAAALRALA